MNERDFLKFLTMLKNLNIVEEVDDAEAYPCYHAKTFSDNENIVVLAGDLPPNWQFVINTEDGERNLYIEKKIRGKRK